MSRTVEFECENGHVYEVRTDHSVTTGLFEGCRYCDADLVKPSDPAAAFERKEP